MSSYVMESRILDRKGRILHLELRAAIMEQQGVDMQTLSAAEHVVTGSDFPYDMGDPEPVKSVQKTNIDSGAKRQIFSENACKLLGIGS